MIHRSAPIPNPAWALLPSEKPWISCRHTTAGHQDSCGCQPHHTLHAGKWSCPIHPFQPIGYRRTASAVTHPATLHVPSLGTAHKLPESSAPRYAGRRLNLFPLHRGAGPELYKRVATLVIDFGTSSLQIDSPTRQPLLPRVLFVCRFNILALDAGFAALPQMTGRDFRMPTLFSLCATHG